MRAFALASLLIACGGAAPASSVRPPPPKRSSCPAGIEVLEAEVFVVKSWRQAARKVDGFDDDFKPETDEEARNVLCRVEACAHAPPFFVKAHLFPFKFPESAIAPLANGRIAVVPLGPTGAGQCVDGKGTDFNSYSGFMSDDTLVLDEEIAPLAFEEEGVCRDGGPSEHVHRVIDPKTKRQIVVRTKEPIRITVSGRAVWIQGSGCDEMRNLDP